MENSGRSSVRLRSIAPPCWPRDVVARHQEADRADPEVQSDREVRSGSEAQARAGQGLGEDPEAQVAPGDRGSRLASVRPAG